MTRAVPFLVLVALILAMRAAPGAPAAPLARLAALQDQGHAVSALVVDLDSGAVLAATAAERALVPASLVKLVTAARALELWGPEKRFSTAVRQRGARDGARLAGDLVLVGGGDPSLTDQDLWRLARAVADSGLRRVEGDLLVDASRFGRLACASEDRCAAARFSRHAFDAPLSAAGVNYSTVALLVAPAGEIGQPARLTLEPYALPSLRIVGTVRTVAGRGAAIAVERLSDGQGERLRVSGEIGVAAPARRVHRSVAEAERYAGELFAAVLAREGVRIAGGVRAVYADPGGEVLVSQPGPPLRAILADMMAYSNNYIADVLALGLLAEDVPAEPVDLPAAGLGLQRSLGDLAAGSRFGGPSSARLADGSGLNPDNRLSARDLVVLLDRLYRRPADFPVFLGSLQVPAYRASPLLGARAEPWDSYVAFKSGGMRDPVRVASLAGYLRLPDYRWAAFALLVNGAPGGPPLSRAEAFTALREDLVDLWLRQ